MGHKLTKIERLDWAAKTMVTIGLFSWGGILFIWYPILKIWIWAPSYSWAAARGAGNIWSWSVIAVVAAVPTIMVWLRYRYAVLAIALANFVIAGFWRLLGFLYSHTPFDWVYYLSFSLAWVLLGVVFLRAGIRLAAVYTPGWDLERDQVERWLQVLQGNGKDDNVIEIQESTFVRGQHTYRFLNAHNCWVIAIFKTGKEDNRPSDFRVREPGAITLLDEPGKPIRAIVDGRVITNSKK